MNSFVELSKFDQWYMKLIYLLLVAVFLLCIGTLLKQEISDVPAGKNGEYLGVVELILVSIIPLSILALLKSFKLKVEIDKEEIRVNLSPIASDKYALVDVKELKLIKYEFIGYGLRFSPTYGKVYNASGNIGLSFKAKNKGKVLIGIKDPKELLGYFTSIGLEVINET